MLETINMEDETQAKEMERLIELQRSLIDQYNERIEGLKRYKQVQLLRTGKITFIGNIHPPGYPSFRFHSKVLRNTTKFGNKKRNEFLH